MASYEKYESKKGTFWLTKIHLGVDPDTGKRKQTSKRGFRTKKEAMEYAREVERKVSLRKKKNIFRGNSLFRTVLDRWFLEYSESGIKKSTIKNRKEIAIPHLLSAFGDMRIGSITAEMYRKMLQNLVAKNYSTWTVDGIHAVGKLVFRYAKENGYTDDFVPEGIKAPHRRKTVDELKMSNLEMNYFEKSELIHFLQVVKEHGTVIDYVFYSFLAYSGVRVGEALALKWEDIHFEEKFVNIYKTLYRYGSSVKGYELTTPKTKQSTRVIYLDDELLSNLMLLKAEQEKYKLITSDYVDQGFVFVKLDGFYSGHPERSGSFSYRLAKYLRIAGITKPITLHKFRHTHISLLAEAGVSIEAIQERVGHGDSRVTRGIYLHVTSDYKQKIAGQFSDFLKVK